MKLVLAINYVLIFSISIFCKEVLAQDMHSVDRETTDGMTLQYREKYCSDSKIPKTLCDKILSEVAFSTFNLKSGGEIDDSIQKVIKTYFADPKNLNADIFGSSLYKKFIGSVPLNLEFKQLEKDGGANVLGLSYSINYDVKKNTIDTSENASLQYALSVSSKGTVTQNSEDNPLDFIDTKISLSGTFLTKFKKLDAADIQTFRNLISEENIDDPDSIRKANEMLLGAFTNPWFIEYGAEVGIESDQKFDAKNAKISAFSTIQYEDFQRQSIVGDLGLVPSMRISLDKIDPNSETPRAIMGDESAYYRASFEVSIWLPLNYQDFAFTYNYRHYQELGASEIVKNASLDKAHLRTYTISGPYGLFASYSSGRLPFGFDDEGMVQLGWKWHFAKN